jgi:hypothetical protein
VAHLLEHRRRASRGPGNHLPAGLEELFRSFGDFTAPPDPQTLAGMAAKYGCDLDFDATFPIVQRHGLVF